MHSYVDLDGMSEENFENWRRFGKKFRHIQKLGRYMAYIGHYLNELRIIGERPSRAELARRRRAALYENQIARFAGLLPLPVTDVPRPTVDPEPEPQ